jgi:hypothetical protein
MESLYLLILLFIIILIIFPFSFNLEFFYDLNLNDGYFIVKVWKIPFKKVNVKRKGINIILIEKRKDKNLEIELNKEQLTFLKVFFNEVKNKIKIRKIEVTSETGTENPFHSSLFSGTYSSFILAVFARLKKAQPTASFQLENKTNFFEFIFTFKTFLRFSISIFDILYSFMLAIVKTRKQKISKSLKKN